jgi:nucleotide-binding universal stress UspA family protein
LIRSILIALDGSASGAVVQDLALAMARMVQAQITALGIVDSPWLTRAEAVPIGGAAYKFASDLARLKTAHERLAVAMESFEQAARKAKVPHVSASLDGDPVELIEARATEHDLIAVGRDMDFHFNDEAEVPAALERLVRDNPRPILVAPRAPVTGEAVLVAFDGSLASSRALHMLALTGAAQGRTIHVLSIDDNAETAGARAQQACTLLKRHGAEVQAIAISSDAAPDDIILSHVQSLRAGLVVMGAYGHRGVRELLLGSCTRRLLTACPTALFVNH